MSRHAMISVVASAMLCAGAGGAVAAQEPVLDPVGVGGRVSVAEAGYAITFPEDWTYVFPTAADTSTILEAAGEFAPELSSTIESALAQGVGFSLLAFGDVDIERGFTENCNVIVSEAAGISLQVVAAAEVAAAEGFGDLLASGPEVTTLELPAGEAARIDYSLAFPEFETLHSVYYFVDDPAVYILTCTALERPTDSWRSIAETFEYVAEDAPADAAEGSAAP